MCRCLVDFHGTMHLLKSWKWTIAILKKNRYFPGISSLVLIFFHWFPLRTIYISVSIYVCFSVLMTAWRYRLKGVSHVLGWFESYPSLNSAFAFPLRHTGWSATRGSEKSSGPHSIQSSICLKTVFLSSSAMKRSVSLLLSTLWCGLKELHLRLIQLRFCFSITPHRFKCSRDVLNSFYILTRQEICSKLSTI